ncbi:MAG: GGDEF domain-containing phosphodiesterase [Treponema sp.]|nr:GGDEF domain-containing phosphodiesterase [Treponema sp.]
MGNSALLLVYNSDFLKNVFSDSQITDIYEVVFSAPDTFENIKLKNQGRFIFLILDETFANESALKQTLNLELPTIVISENLTESQQILLYEGQVDDIIENVSRPQILLHKLENLRHKYYSLHQKLAAVEIEIAQEAKRFTKNDEKSGLYTLEGFKEQAENILKANRDKEYIICHFDIDRFKVFNELYGFSGGDKLLSIIGEEIKKRLKADECAGRIRADHFIICMKKNNLNYDEFCAYYSQYLSSHYPDFYFNVRLGVFDIGNKEINVNLFIQNSHLALLSLKGDFSKKYAVYTEEMSSALKEEQELISDMVEALDNGDFKVWMQPQYDYSEDVLTGAEALVRWQHPKKGVIPPSKFVPVFEYNGFISKLDEYVWDKTCSLLKGWIDKGLNPVPVSVNISRRDINNKDVVSHFKSLLQKYSLTPKDLRLEITESAYMENPRLLISVVKDLQKAGFVVEMDDFGSGYSSLNTLKDVPVDVLKLDMKFILDENNNPVTSENGTSKSGNILSSVVRMANWLRLPVIAEGIETKEQAEYLKSIGCFNMQGYYFAKPMPPEEYEKLLETIPVVQGEEVNSPAENEKPLDFLDSSIQTTLLFNSFVGGAAIIEWTGATVEALRINDQYFEELGTTRADYSSIHQNLLNRMDWASRSVFLTNLSEASRLGRPAFCEVKCNPIYPGQKPFWLRMRIRHLTKTVTSDIFFLAIDNIDFRMHLLELNTTLSEQLAGIMETVPCGIMSAVYDRVSDNFSISYLNEYCAKIFGCNPGEFRIRMHDNPFSIFEREVQPEKIKIMKEFLMSGKSEYRSVISVKVPPEGEGTLYNYAASPSASREDEERSPDEGKSVVIKEISVIVKVALRSDGLQNVSIAFVDLSEKQDS